MLLPHSQLLRFASLYLLVSISHTWQLSIALALLVFVQATTRRNTRLLTKLVYAAASLLPILSPLSAVYDGMSALAGTPALSLQRTCHADCVQVTVNAIWNVNSLMPSNCMQHTTGRTTYIYIYIYYIFSGSTNILPLAFILVCIVVVVVEV